MNSAVSNVNRPSDFCQVEGIIGTIHDGDVVDQWHEGTGTDRCFRVVDAWLKGPVEKKYIPAYN